MTLFSWFIHLQTTAWKVSLMGWALVDRALAGMCGALQALFYYVSVWLCVPETVTRAGEALALLLSYTTSFIHFFPPKQTFLQGSLTSKLDTTKCWEQLSVTWHDSLSLLRWEFSPFHLNKRRNSLRHIQVISINALAVGLQCETKWGVLEDKHCESRQSVW